MRLLVAAAVLSLACIGCASDGPTAPFCRSARSTLNRGIAATGAGSEFAKALAAVPTAGLPLVQSERYASEVEKLRFAISGVGQTPGEYHWTTEGVAAVVRDVCHGEVPVTSAVA